ncbi:hypothetical protein PRIC2_007022 [Phytophthora ramorum]|uniref:uncharacterized protein n=1 Tax=Phytophthora ramorum TaxID=164328 RepID=UPI00309F7FC1|nr:hypothetical protein KRP23_2386 [Phytophthora ramorum]
MERVEDGSSMNVAPPMFHAGISNKFTKRHLSNFRDTTLTAASAAKQRAERKLERQADAIEKQQQKIDSEMKKIGEITQNLHRQQLREAKRLRNRLNYAASKIQVRLNPVVIPSVKSNSSDLATNEIEVEEDASALEMEERLHRHEEFKQKLQLRRNQEKRQQEHELKLKREAETEANERKLMEREEKAIRLQLKILRRRSKEGKIRQVTADQRREERERLAMAREERHVRLHIKFCARQNKKRQQLATASTNASESDSRPPSTSTSSRREGHARRKSPATKPCKMTTKSKSGGDASSEDDGDMSFLDIDFAIPASMKSRQHIQGGNNSGSSQSRTGRVNSSAIPPKKKKKHLAGGKTKQGSTLSRKPGREVTPLPVDMPAETDHEDDCGYGDEFEEVVDEAALSHLIC